MHPHHGLSHEEVGTLGVSDQYTINWNITTKPQVQNQLFAADEVGLVRSLVQQFH